MAHGVSAKTRAKVIDRDKGICQWDGCSDGLGPGMDYSLQHRWPRAMGGSSVDWVNLPANLVLVAGSGTTLCHGHMESHRAAAEARGFIIRKGILQPAQIPIDTFFHGLVLLDDDGGFDLFEGGELAEWKALKRFGATT